MSYKLNKPCTDKQRADFVVLHNHNNGRQIAETQTALYALEANEIMQDGEPIINPDYEQEQAQKEAERIAMLNLTAADVERAIYKAKGIDFEDIVNLVNSEIVNSESKDAETAGLSIDIKALKIELKANNFYRGNPYIDAVGTILGLTSEQLNRFFDTNDYKYLTTVTLTINPTPADAVVLINGEAQESVTVPYGDTVNYSVAAEGYLTHLGSVEMTEDKTIEVELVEEVVEGTDEVENADTTDTES